MADRNTEWTAELQRFAEAFRNRPPPGPRTEVVCFPAGEVQDALAEAVAISRQLANYRELARDRRDALVIAGARIDALETELDATRKALDTFDALAAELGRLIGQAKELLGLEPSDRDEEILSLIRSRLTEQATRP